LTSATEEIQDRVLNLDCSELDPIVQAVLDDETSASLGSLSCQSMGAPSVGARTLTIGKINGKAVEIQNVLSRHTNQTGESCGLPSVRSVARIKFCGSTRNSSTAGVIFGCAIESPVNAACGQ